MAWTGWLGLVTLGLLAGVLAVVSWGQRRWNRVTDELLRGIESQRQRAVPGHYDVRELDGLPEPVQRYFGAVLREGQPMIASATLSHLGTFNIGVGGERWRPFRSRQRVVMRRPGFVWDASIRMLPGMPIRVHDAYVGGVGILSASLLGLFTFAARRGEGDELAQGELMRFLAEAAWYPTALLPSQGVSWAAEDGGSARATLSDGSLRVSLLFRFDAHGLIESVHADARGRTVGRDVVATPWEGRWSDYEERNGVRVPIAGEVAWLAPGGRLAYWRGRLASLEHQT
jgi:hypothetical protein